MLRLKLKLHNKLRDLRLDELGQLGFGGAWVLLYKLCNFTNGSSLRGMGTGTVSETASSSWWDCGTTTWKWGGGVIKEGNAQ